MDKIHIYPKFICLLVLLIHQCVGPPPKHRENEVSGDASKHNASKGGEIDDLGLEYNRYLSEVVNALESDPEFRKKLESADEADFRTGKVAAELEYVNHRVRTKLDELKRTELERMRHLVRQTEELERNEINPNHMNPGHVDHSNPHTFEAADLHKLITQVRQDLAEADKQRRGEFKEYELQKKFEQEEKIKALDEEHKKQYLHELEEQKKKHQKHQPLHHPGSQSHLEEVWEKEDHMANQKFNPKTFFMLHDINGDGYWDEDEVKALFITELNKLYEAGVAEDDMREREEEMERMREHVFKESDTNGDRLISYPEFLEQTKKDEFKKNDGWESIDTQPQFTQNEYEEFEKRRHEEIQRLIDRGLLQPHPPGMMPPPGYAAHPGQYQQQQYHPGQHPNQVPHQQQYGQNVGYNSQGVPQQAQYHAQAVPQHPSQGMPHNPQGVQGQYHPQGVPVQQHPQQGVPVPQHQQQGAPLQHHQQGVAAPQHQQQGVPLQHHQQGVPVQRPPQGVPAQPQYSGQQYGGHNINQGQHQQPGQVPVQAVPQQNPPSRPNAVPNQQNIPQNQPAQMNQGQVPPVSNQQPPQQQYRPDTNQIVPNQVPNQGAPLTNQQQPPSNQASNQQYNQVPQAQTGQQPPSYQQGNVNNNQIHTDNNKVQNNIPSH